MTKTILITGATDGIGLETARHLAGLGHELGLHGRNPDKLARVISEISEISSPEKVHSFRADFSDLNDVAAMAEAVKGGFAHLDVLINNAGIFKSAQTQTADGLDIRFVVNTLAPYLLTRELLPIMNADSRVVNLSSAAQAPVDLAALRGQAALEDFPAYAQSKLAITMWTAHMARLPGTDRPLFVSVNPGSLLGTKMVREGFGQTGNDVGIGVDILVRASLSDEFIGRSGEYFDNDNHRFAAMHPAGQDLARQAALVDAIDRLVDDLPGS